jgi:hypothetical protein
MADTTGTNTGGGTTVNISIPDYSTYFQQLVQLATNAVRIATNATTATIIPAATLSTTGTIGLLTVSNTVTTIGAISVGMVLECQDITPGTIVLAPGPGGNTWTGWYINKPQDLEARPITGLGPVLSVAANVSSIEANIKLLSKDGIKTNSYNWSDVVKTYSWYVEGKNAISPEKVVDLDFANFVKSITSVTNQLPKFL